MLLLLLSLGRGVLRLLRSFCCCSCSRSRRLVVAVTVAVVVAVVMVFAVFFLLLTSACVRRGID